MTYGHSSPKRCDCCNEVYLARRPTQRFCSVKCKHTYRRMQGTDDVDATCEVCGKTFRKNKYKKQRTCGNSCARALTERERKTTAMRLDELEERLTRLENLNGIDTGE